MGISAAELGMVLLVGGSTRVPAVVEEVRRITGKEPSHNLNPDECVALGAAVQGGKLGGAIVAGSSAAEIILMDVTPLSLGIETVGGVSTKIIDRNTTKPGNVSEEQAAEIKHAADELRNAAAGLDLIIVTTIIHLAIYEKRIFI